MQIRQKWTKRRFKIHSGEFSVNFDLALTTAIYIIYFFKIHNYTLCIFFHIVIHSFRKKKIYPPVNYEFWNFGITFLLV